MTEMRKAGKPASTKIRVARLALAQLVAEARPDWDRDEFDGIVHSALRSLEEPEQRAVFASLLLRTGRLLGIDDSSAADVRQESRSPVQPGARAADPMDPEQRDDLLAPARLAMARASAEYRERVSGGAA